MARAVPHETDEGKWQSGFNDYGHGPGKGMSRNSIYNEFKRFKNSEEVETVEYIEPEVTIQDSFPEGNEWVKSSWMDDATEGDVKTKTIPEPLSEMAECKMSEFNFAAQGKVVLMSFVALDRLITHWGRGVMSNDEWSIERTPEDYDSLENAAVGMLAYYDVRIPITPPMIFGVTLGHAYVPQISHVMRNRDPNRKKRGFFSRIFRRKAKKDDEGVDEK